MSDEVSTSTRREGTTRLPGLDAVKAVAAIGVVAIHAAPVSGQDYRHYVLGGAALLAVPVFITVSGLLAGFRMSSDESMRSNLKRFVRLHIVWGLFYGVVVRLSGLSTGDFDLHWFLQRVGEGSYPGQYYFVVMIQIYAVCALAPFLRLPARIWERGAVLAASALAAVGGLLVASSSVDALRPPLVDAFIRLTLASVNLIWFWFFYFALGAFMGRSMRAASWRMNDAGAVALVVAAVVVVTAGWPLFPQIEDRTIASYLRVTVYAAATLFALALPRIAHWPAPAGLTFVGRESFGIFVLNPVLLITLERTVGRPASPLYSLFAVVGVVLVATGLSRALRARVPWAMP